MFEFQSPLSWGRLPYKSFQFTVHPVDCRFNPLSRGAVFLTMPKATSCMPKATRFQSPPSWGCLPYTSISTSATARSAWRSNPLSREAVFLTPGLYRQCAHLVYGVSIPYLVGPSSFVRQLSVVSHQFSVSAPLPALSWGRPPYHITGHVLAWLGYELQPPLSWERLPYSAAGARRMVSKLTFQSPLSWGRLPSYGSSQSSVLSKCASGPLSRGAVLLTHPRRRHAANRL